MHFGPINTVSSTRTHMDTPTTQTDTMDEITNLRLVENGLFHIEFECDRAVPSYFRIAREAHLLLYRSMTEALRGSANLAVTAQLPNDRSVCYQRGTGQWQEIHRTVIPECKKAWRFSEPAPCAPPNTSTRCSAQPSDRNYLIGFYDTLAMIQTECFMGRFVHSRWRFLPDMDMKHLEWLHERIRNEYEHFVPKFYIAPARDLLQASRICIDVSDNVLFESNNVLFHGMSQEPLRSLLRSVFGKVNDLRN